MSFRQLVPGTTTRLRMEGMLEVRVVTAGSNVPAELNLEGEGRYNRMSGSAFKLLECSGEISVSIQPGRGTDFSNAVSATVQISSGRRGSSAEEIIEFPPATLSDNSPLRIATLTRNDGWLEVSTANTSVGQSVAGLGGIVRSNLRPMIDASNSYLPDDMGVRVFLDCGAAMATPALIGLIPQAVNVITGSVAACSSLDSVELCWGHDGTERVSLEMLESRVVEIVKKGHRYVGGAEYSGDGMSHLTFVISDVAPAVVEFAESNAVALVLGDNPVDIPVEGNNSAIVNIGSSFESRLSAPVTAADSASGMQHPLKIVSEAIATVVQGTLPAAHSRRKLRGTTDFGDIEPPAFPVPGLDSNPTPDAPGGGFSSGPNIDVPSFGGFDPQPPQQGESRPSFPDAPFAGNEFPGNSETPFPNDSEFPGNWR